MPAAEGVPLAHDIEAATDKPRNAPTPHELVACLAPVSEEEPRAEDTLTAEPATDYGDDV
jgi:hypothetical protein